MSRFEIGKGVFCDLSRLVETRLLVQANSGGGKSWCIRRLLEQTHGKVQHLVIDPEGEFATLREKFDYVLAAKSGGDTAAHPRSARLLAERLLELNASAILDIYELKPHERIAFVQNFLEALVDAPKSLWHPALIVVDEAHVYCPQKGDAASASAVVDICTRGRKRGFCAVLATQRLAKLHKDAAAELNNKLIGRTGLDVDMDRAADELGMSGRDQKLALRQLPDGDFFAFGPAISLEVKQVHVGGVETHHPESGARVAFNAPPPSARVRAMLPKLADLPAEAEERTRSLQEAQKEITHLKHELTVAKKAQPVVAKAETKVVEKAVLKDAQITRLEVALGKLESYGSHWGGILVELGREMSAAIKSAKNGHAPVPALAANRLVVPPTRPVVSRKVDTVPSDGLTGPEQRILNAIGWLESIGVAEPEQTATAFLAGYTYGGGAFNNPKGRLRAQGLVEYLAGDRIRLTDAGRELAQVPETPLTTQELHQRVLNQLPGPERRILEVILAEYPTPLANAECAERAGYSPDGGAYNNPRGRLRSLGLIEYQSGKVVARSILFPEGQ